MAARRKKTSSRKKVARKKTSGKKAARKGTARKATRKKSAAKKAPARKKAAAKKAPARKKAATKKAPAHRKSPTSAKPASDPLKTLARKIVRAGINADSVPLEHLYAVDCESWEAGATEPVVGLEGLRQKFANWGQMQEGTTFKALNVWTGPNTVLVEWDGQVKLRGGPTVNLREVAVHEIRNGKIQSERYYYNPASLAPPQASATPPAREGGSDSGESGWD